MSVDIIELDDLAKRTVDYSDQLRDVSKRFYGYEDRRSGKKYPGVKLAYEEALDKALTDIYGEYEDQGKRAPGEDVRKARARMRVKREQPDLADEYFILEATIGRIQRWLSDTKSAIWARQSVLKTEREMAGRA